MKKVFAIVGCGHIAHRHIKHIQAHTLGEIAGVFDIDSSRMTEMEDKYGVSSYDSYANLLLDDTVDVVSICTPNGTHAELAIQAMKAGKNVLVEKPMATALADAAQMEQVANEQQVKLFVVKQNRYNPPVREVKERINANQLGQPLLVVVNCFWNRNEAYYQQSNWRGTKDLDGGTLYTQFSHFVDILYYLFGEITDVQGRVSNVAHEGLIEFEDTGAFSFKFKNGGMGSLTYTTASYEQNMEGSITIFSENATIKIGGKYLNTIDYQVTNGFDIENIPLSSPANNYGFYEGSMSNHAEVIDNVIETLNGRQEIMTNGHEGMKVVEMIDQFYKAAN